jgi:hypothetical protein
MMRSERKARATKEARISFQLADVRNKRMNLGNELFGKAAPARRKIDFRRFREDYPSGEGVAEAASWKRRVSRRGTPDHARAMDGEASQTVGDGS